jgi:hypothetical protein
MIVCLYSCLRYPVSKALLCCATLGCHFVCLAVPYFSALFHKRRGFREKVIEHKIFVLIFLNPLSETFLIVRKNYSVSPLSCRTSHPILQSIELKSEPRQTASLTVAAWFVHFRIMAACTIHYII